MTSMKLSRMPLSCNPCVHYNDTSHSTVGKIQIHFNHLSDRCNPSPLRVRRLEMLEHDIGERERESLPSAWKHERIEHDPQACWHVTASKEIWCWWRWSIVRRGDAGGFSTNQPEVGTESWFKTRSMAFQSPQAKDILDHVSVFNHTHVADLVSKRRGGSSLCGWLQHIFAWQWISVAFLDSAPSGETRLWLEIEPC